MNIFSFRPGDLVVDPSKPGSPHLVVSVIGLWGNGTKDVFLHTVDPYHLHDFRGATGKFFPSLPKEGSQSPLQLYQELFQSRLKGEEWNDFFSVSREGRRVVDRFRELSFDREPRISLGDVFDRNGQAWILCSLFARPYGLEEWSLAASLTTPASPLEKPAFAFEENIQKKAVRPPHIGARPNVLGLRAPAAN